MTRGVSQPDLLTLWRMLPAILHPGQSHAEGVRIILAELGYRWAGWAPCSCGPLPYHVHCLMACGYVKEVEV
jgi:hypothetical protein